jgi:hypothetical protein
MPGDHFNPTTCQLAIQGTMPPFLAAAWASYYGDRDLTVEGLRASPRSLFAGVGSIWDPMFAETRRIAAFKTFLRDFGFLEYWRAQNERCDVCRQVSGGGFECR